MTNKDLEEASGGGDRDWFEEGGCLNRDKWRDGVRAMG